MQTLSTGNSDKSSLDVSTFSQPSERKEDNIVSSVDILNNTHTNKTLEKLGEANLGTIHNIESKLHMVMMPLRVLFEPNLEEKSAFGNKRKVMAIWEETEEDITWRQKQLGI